MSPFQERHSKRFHVTLQVPNLKENIQEYNEILGDTPCCVVPDRLALWRTAELNFLLRAKPKQRTTVLQFGWEFDYCENTEHFKDRNQLSWLFFSTSAQDDAINRLNVALKYNEDKDFLLELRNPNAHGNLWISFLLIIAMVAFTVFNNGWLAKFFHLVETQPTNQIEEELQQLYSVDSQLKAVGKLLKQADYQVDYLANYGIARHSEQASITFQLVGQQILFSTYWALDNKISHILSEQDIRNKINNINQEAIMCRYYQDKAGDLAVETWLSLSPLLLLEQNNQGQEVRAKTKEETEYLAFSRKKAANQWQRALALWQQESLSWLQTSSLFGGDLEPQQSFSKK